MKFLIAADKFKDALSALDACEIIAEALAELDAALQTDCCPLTDGGEGFAEILTRSCHGRIETVHTCNARGRTLTAPVGFVPWTQVPLAARARLKLDTLHDDDEVALVGMASASGLEQLSADERDPWQASSLGTGELLVHARRRGVRAILLGIGGSATHDLGLGALRAMGCRFSDEDGANIDRVNPDRWATIARIDLPPRDWPAVRIACDVTNPLLGQRGAANVYSAQKGIRPDEIPALESATERMARLLCAHADAPFETTAGRGMGAAGGIAFGLRTIFGAELVEGAPLVSEWLSIEARIAAADCVITGEGRFDASSLEGKGPGSVVRLAVAHGKPVHFFAGAAQISPGEEVELHVITPPGDLLPRALKNARANLRRAVRDVFRDPPARR